MREMNKKRYLIAGVLTFLIFFIGFLVGDQMDEQRLGYLSKNLREQRTEYMSLQTQYLYISSLPSEKFCKVANPTLKENLERLSKLLDRLESYEEGSDFNKEEYRVLKREYTISNLRYWMLLKKVKKNCGRNDVSILYFYNKECDICPRQGFVLTQLRSKYEGDLWVFPLDTGLDENMINILKARYNITEVPSLVVNNKVYLDLQSYGKLDKIVARNLENTTKS